VMMSRRQRHRLLVTNNLKSDTHDALLDLTSFNSAC
jgi:hypothetical protein